jgi:hypothetical protein
MGGNPASLCLMSLNELERALLQSSLLALDNATEFNVCTNQYALDTFSSAKAAAKESEDAMKARSTSQYYTAAFEGATATGMGLYAYGASYRSSSAKEIGSQKPALDQNESALNNPANQYDHTVNIEAKPAGVPDGGVDDFNRLSDGVKARGGVVNDADVAEYERILGREAPGGDPAGKKAALKTEIQEHQENQFKLQCKTDLQNTGRIQPQTLESDPGMAGPNETRGDLYKKASAQEKLAMEEGYTKNALKTMGPADREAMQTAIREQRKVLSQKESDIARSINDAMTWSNMAKNFATSITGGYYTAREAHWNYESGVNSGISKLQENSANQTSSLQSSNANFASKMVDQSLSVISSITANLKAAALN